MNTFKIDLLKIITTNKYYLDFLLHNKRLKTRNVK